MRSRGWRRPRFGYDRFASVCAFTGGALAVFAACSSSQPPDVRPPPPPETAIPAPAAPPLLRVVPYEKPAIDARAIDVLNAAASAKPASLDVAPPPELTKQALDDTARAEARGLTLDAPVHVANIGERGHATMPIDVKKGDCITVIAHGGLGVMEVDAFLVEHGSHPSKIVAAGTAEGPMAVVGGQHGCVPFIDEGAVDVVVQARKGDGPVVFAIYRGRP